MLRPAAGLVYRLPGADGQPALHDDMASLVYRVHPVPAALHDFIFDFGALTPDNEALYVQKMVAQARPSPFAFLSRLGLYGAHS